MTAKHTKSKLLLTILLAPALTHLLSQVELAAAAGSAGPESSQTPSQPAWPNQGKPNSYNGPQAARYPVMSSLFDALGGLSQRQGTITTGASPLTTILPIILIAAGGLLLLLPLLTMSMASPFGAFGGLGGGYQNLGYPQVGALSRRRSLDGLVEQVSSAIENFSKKYSISKLAESVNFRSADERSQRVAPDDRKPVDS